MAGSSTGFEHADSGAGAIFSVAVIQHRASYSVAMPSEALGTPQESYRAAAGRGVRHPHEVAPYGRLARPVGLLAAVRVARPPTESASSPFCLLHIG